MSGVTAYVFSTRRDAVASWSFSIHTHEVSGSTPVVQVTVYLSGRIIPVFLGGGGGGKLLVLERNYLGFGSQHPELEKSMCFISYQKFLIGQVFSQSKPFTQHSRIFYEMKFIYL